MTLTRRTMLQVGGTFAGYCLAADPVLAQAIKTLSDYAGIAAAPAGTGLSEPSTPNAAGDPGAAPEAAPSGSDRGGTA